METISNEEKVKEIAENAKLPLSLNEADDVLRAINICSKKGYFKSAVKYGALTMAQWKDEQYEQQKQQWIEKACKWWEREFLYPTMAQEEIDFYQTKIAEFKKEMKGE